MVDFVGPGTIIYRKTKDDVTNLYLFFLKSSPEGEFFCIPQIHSDYRIVDMYMSSTDPDVKQIITHRFTKDNNL